MKFSCFSSILIVVMIVFFVTQLNPASHSPFVYKNKGTKTETIKLDCNLAHSLYKKLTTIDPRAMKKIFYGYLYSNELDIPSDIRTLIICILEDGLEKKKRCECGCKGGWKDMETQRHLQISDALLYRVLQLILNTFSQPDFDPQNVDLWVEVSYEKIKIKIKKTEFFKRPKF